MKVLDNKCLRTALLALFGVATTSANTAPLTHVGTLSPPICYRLSLGSWKLLNPRGGIIANGQLHPEPWWQPPSTILLDANPPTTDEKRKGWLRDATNAVRPSGVPSPHWMFDVGSWKREAGGQILVLWGGGYVATTIRFPALNTKATGILTVHSDDLSAPLPTCEVSLEQVACTGERPPPRGNDPG